MAVEKYLLRKEILLRSGGIYESRPRKTKRKGVVSNQNALESNILGSKSENDQFEYQ